MTRVLVVEDEESFSDALSYMLRKEGFEVAVCPTGPDAIETFDRTGADLVLLDLMLPGLPGSEVCRSLRERSNVPVIMLTAKDSEIDKVVGLELGADDYVTSPSPHESWSPGCGPCSAAAATSTSRSARSWNPAQSAWTSSGTWSPSEASRCSFR